MERYKRWDEVEKTFSTYTFARQVPGLGTGVGFSTLQSGIN